LGWIEGDMASDEKRAQNPLVAKLLQFTPLSDEDIRVLEALCSSEKRFKGGVDILAEGDAMRSTFIVTHGMACRYRLLSDGRRQVLSFFIPGDFFGLHAFLLGSIDHFISTVGPTRLAEIDRDTVIEMVTHHPRIRAALWWSARQEDAMLRERIVALGRRSARGRVAYLLCELVWRQRATGVSEVIGLPLTQIDLADALGLTPVYVNRILQAFRREQLITLQQHQLTLLDVEKLQTISGVTPDYLQLGTISPDIIDYFDPLGRSLGGSISHPTPKSAVLTRFCAHSALTASVGTVVSPSIRSSPQ
jgi:CRP-like cAMP-binding protein